MALVQDFVIYCWLSVVVIAVGACLLKCFGWAFAWPFETLWLSATLGWSVVIGAVFLLGCFHVFTIPVVVAILLLMSVWLAQHGEFNLRRETTGAWLIHNCLRQTRNLARKHPLLTGAVGFVVVSAFLGCGAPEVRGDPIIYHLTEAWLFVVNRGHVEIPSSVLTYIPQNQQLLYALALLLGNDSLAKLFHWTMGMLLLCGTYTTAHALNLDRRGALSAVFLLAAVPMWFYLATTTYIDLATGNYILAAVYCALIWEGGWARIRRAGLAGVFLGVALGTKYTAGVVGALPLFFAQIWACLDDWRRKRFSLWRTVFIPAVVLAGVALIIFMPWLVRNWLWTGNPLAPSFLAWLGPADVPEDTIQWPDIQAFNTGILGSFSSLVAAYTGMFLSFSDYGNFLPLVTLILGLTLLGVVFLQNNHDRKKRDPRVRAIIIFLVVAFVAGVPLVAVRRDSRYIMAHVALLAVLTVLAYERLWQLLPNYRVLLGGGARAFLLSVWLTWAAMSWLRYCDLKEWCWPIFSQEARIAYCEQRLDRYRPNLKLGEVLQPEDGKVLGAAYPARVDYVLGGMPLTRDLLVQRPEILTSAALPGLTRQGVQYLFGKISHELAPYVVQRGTVEGIPLWEIRSPLLLAPRDGGAASNSTVSR